jgi:hypothetical protein
MSGSSRELPESVRSEIQQLLRRGRMIEAVKIHRAATGAGLAESRAALLAMERELEDEPAAEMSPGADPVVKTKAGCFSSLLLLAATLAATAALAAAVAAG